MPLRNFADVRYIPMLGLRPAEMEALEELPNRDKELLLPFFQIGPWATAHNLSSSISRLDAAYGSLPCIVTLCDAEPVASQRPVHDQISELRNPSGGCAAWCEFIEAHSNYIPTIQSATPVEFRAQAARLHRLGRGLVMNVPSPLFSAVDGFAQILAPVSDDGRDVCFILDFGRQVRDMLGIQIQAIGYVDTILRRLPNAYVALSASSFPESFGGIDRQEIFERSFFEEVKRQTPERLIYSDRGSVRAERQTGGGGTPNPRIDYPTRAEWTFFRSEDFGPDAYVAQALNATISDGWDGAIRIWGTQMIERTSTGDTSAIMSPKRSTAARINIHLHRQLFFGDQSGLYDTDDQWVD